MRIVASLTTIPPRVQRGDIYRCIDSLLDQTRTLDQIYVNVAAKYQRFDSLNTWDLQELKDYHPLIKVVVIDYDTPLIKHLGPYMYEPADSVQFVCDDDQEYHPRLIERMIEGYFDRRSLMQNRYHFVRTGSGGIVHGFVGCMYTTSLMKGFYDGSFTVPRQCWVDDQLMSIYCHEMGIRIIPSPVMDYDEIYSRLDEYGNEQNGGKEALHKFGSRDEQIQVLEKLYRVRFVNQHNPNGRGLIVDV